jgi:hypothetical protein
MNQKICNRCCKSPCCCGSKFPKAPQLAKPVDQQRVSHWSPNQRQRTTPWPPVHKCGHPRINTGMNRPMVIQRKGFDTYVFHCTNHKCDVNTFVATENLLTLVKTTDFCHGPINGQKEFRLYETKCPRCNLVCVSSRILRTICCNEGECS